MISTMTLPMVALNVRGLLALPTLIVGFCLCFPVTSEGQRLSDLQSEAATRLAQRIRGRATRVAVFPIFSNDSSYFIDGIGYTSGGEGFERALVESLGNKALRGNALESALREGNRSVGMLGNNQIYAKSLARSANCDWYVTGSIDYSGFGSSKGREKVTVHLTASSTNDSSAPVVYHRVIDRPVGKRTLKDFAAARKRPATFVIDVGFKPNPGAEFGIHIDQAAVRIMASLPTGFGRQKVGIVPSFAGPGRGPSKLHDRLVEAIEVVASSSGRKAVRPDTLQSFMSSIDASFGGRTFSVTTKKSGDDLAAEFDLTWLVELRFASAPDAFGRVKCDALFAPVGDSRNGRKGFQKSVYIGNQISGAEIARSSLSSRGRIGDPLDAEVAIAQVVSDVASEVLEQSKLDFGKARIWLAPLATPALVEARVHESEAVKDFAIAYNRLYDSYADDKKPSEIALFRVTNPISIQGRKFKNLGEANVYLSGLAAHRNSLAKYGRRMSDLIADRLRDNPRWARAILLSKNERGGFDVIDDDEGRDSSGRGAVDDVAIKTRRTDAKTHVLLPEIAPRGKRLRLQMKLMALDSTIVSQKPMFLPKDLMHAVNSLEGDVVTSAGGSLTELYKRIVGGVTLLEGRVSGKVITGTGFIISNEGYALTNHHVVAGVDSMIAHFKHGGKPALVTVIAADRELDVAIIKLSYLPANAHIFKLGSSEMVQVGQPIAVVGHPQGRDWTMTSGIISNKKLADRRGSVMYDAGTLGGSSGSPVILHDGVVIAVHSAGALDRARVKSQGGGYETVGLAVPVPGFAMGCNVGKVLDFLKSNNVRVK